MHQEQVFTNTVLPTQKSICALVEDTLRSLSNSSQFSVTLENSLSKGIQYVTKVGHPRIICMDVYS